MPFRYLLLLMGFFATYCGAIYNEFLSIPTNLFESCYNQQDLETSELYKYSYSCVYPFGFDPRWTNSKTELKYYNSFKMKFAVIVGVLQMTLGILLKAINCIYFSNWLDFFCEFLPQIIFMCLVFGYMIAQIFIKWCVDWSQWRHNGPTPPSIITNMINFALNNGKLGTESPLWGDGQEQEEIQALFFKIALVCVIVMLFPKAIYLVCRIKIKQSQEQQLQLQQLNQYYDQDDVVSVEQLDNNENTDIELMDFGQRKQEVQNLLQKEKNENQSQPENPDKPKNHHENPGEIVVHQVIETIEFVLGSVSHTASYLRLWALSLAHSQLSKIFYSKTIGSGGSLIAVILSFPVFCALTLGVIMLMDTLECCLHAVRLHWFILLFCSHVFLGWNFRANFIKVVENNLIPAILYQIQNNYIIDNLFFLNQFIEMLNFLIYKICLKKQKLLFILFLCFQIIFINS